jgi:hypothetical protein
MTDTLGQIAQRCGTVTDEQQADDERDVGTDDDTVGEYVDVQDEYDGGWSTES